jgi:tetratricopeptide (TPR) repeat protein
VPALANHDRAIELDPDRFDLYWERGVTCLQIKDFDRAITNFEACLERNSKFGNAHLGLGQALRNKGDSETALLHNNEAIALNPRSAWFHRERGYTYKMMGEKEKADADFTRAQELEQNRR